MKLKPEIKARWVAALREPGRKQTIGRLEREDGSQCCLGVLCEIAHSEGVVDKSIDKSDESDICYEYGLSNGLLPMEVRDWAWGSFEADSGFGRLNEPVGEHRYLSDLNDVAEYTFNEIADVIEEQF